MSLLPKLPPHARYVFHENQAYDWGTLGWLLLESGHVDRHRYRYFVFVNSSVRGPFLPPYARVRRAVLRCAALCCAVLCCAVLCCALGSASCPWPLVLHPALKLGVLSDPPPHPTPQPQPQPYNPTTPKGLIHWTEPLLSRLDATVKLVGPTISCEGTPLDGDQKGIWRRNPHVQSYVAATDEVGLQLLIDDGRVFQGHR